MPFRASSCLRLRRRVRFALPTFTFSLRRCCVRDELPLARQQRWRSVKQLHCGAVGAAHGQRPVQARVVHAIREDVAPFGEPVEPHLCAWRVLHHQTEHAVFCALVTAATRERPV